MVIVHWGHSTQLSPFNSSFTCEGNDHYRNHCTKSRKKVERRTVWTHSFSAACLYHAVNFSYLLPSSCCYLHQSTEVAVAVITITVIAVVSSSSSSILLQLFWKLQLNWEQHFFHFETSNFIRNPVPSRTPRNIPIQYTIRIRFQTPTLHHLLQRAAAPAWRPNNSIRNQLASPFRPDLLALPFKYLLFNSVIS